MPTRTTGGKVREEEEAEHFPGVAFSCLHQLLTDMLRLPVLCTQAFWCTSELRCTRMLWCKQALWCAQGAAMHVSIVV
eukprot:8393857-Pyramimonas_sp.AAC.1